MRPAKRIQFFATLAVAAGCAGPMAVPRPALRYVGSSTIANFIREAEPAYRRVRFSLDTEPESVGGELAILEGRADLAGVAGWPRPSTLQEGVVASRIGQDAIAVLVHRANPVNGLTLAELRGIFTGEIRNWEELGGPNLAIQPYIVGPASATRYVFRSAVLGEADYSECEVVRPDAAILERIEADSRGIGPLSVSFLHDGGRVKALAVDGERPDPANAAYAITRPLHLLWWPGRKRVSDFIAWTETTEARAILRRCFAGGAAGEADTE